MYSQIAYSFISQIFKISNVLNVMLGIQWLKKKKKMVPFTLKRHTVAEETKNQHLEGRVLREKRGAGL